MKSKDRILVVDDDRSFRHLIKTGLANDGYEIDVASNVAECVEQLDATEPNLLLLDLNLPDGDGIDVLKSVRNADSGVPIILITGTGDSNSAIDATRFGAYDYLTKPVDLGRLRSLVHGALNHNGLSHDSDPLGGPIKPIPTDDHFIGRSAAMQAVFKSIGRVAKQNVAVLIRGESGTGKELVAKAIWQHSDRANETFLAVNCAAMTGELLESEMFGHEKGAFTGADHRHIGKFEVCASGTLFLDEVGDMPLRTQSKLLRVLQERMFNRVGGNQSVKTEARIISATHRDLEKMCRAGEFREDLFHRLNGFTIEVPALRDRDDDIRLLTANFLARNNQKLSKKIEGISAEAAQKITEYLWPGNVRELESLVGQIMLNVQGTVIDAEVLPGYIVANLSRPSRSATPLPGNSAADPDGQTPVDGVRGEFDVFVDSLVEGEETEIYARMLEYVERHLLSRVLKATDGNQTAAAKRLGITRGSLRFKLKNLGLTIDSEVKVPQAPR